VIETKPYSEQAILIGYMPEKSRAGSNGINSGTGEGWDAGADGDEASLEELALLADTAGSKVVGQVLQRKRSLHPATFLRKGKMEEVKELIEEREANLVLFDEELSPAQARNLSEAFGVKVIDRTELILDIFARRARTREAQLQVELAQLQYLLPRLTRMWVHLSRQVGGIGTRGPGETQLEVDRRRIRTRISMLKKRLERVERERETQSQRRQQLFRASFVGYTNAGKSTLFNSLTRAGVLAEDKLFATLETTTRRLSFGGTDMILLSDTVGFIRKLPHNLIASFRATLGEVRDADLLIHVVDASHPAFKRQMMAVDKVVEELLGERSIEQLLVFNKADQLSDDALLSLRAEFSGSIVLSAIDRKQALSFKDKLGVMTRERRTHG
jgi:GTPase